MARLSQHLWQNRFWHCIFTRTEEAPLPKFTSFGSVAICGTCLALGFAAALPLTAAAGEKSPEFYGAFSAAIVAAAALILSASYQDWLKQRQEENTRKRSRNAEAIDLCFWLYHSVHELEFIERVLNAMRSDLLSNDQEHIGVPPEQFREIVSAHFFEELLIRAKMASQLPPNIAGTVTEDIYDTFTAADRIFRLRGAANDFRPSIKELDSYLVILEQRIKRLGTAAILIKSHLEKTKALTSP